MNKVNVYGSFTQALFFSGITGLPKFLLDHYHELGISNEEIILMLHIVNNPMNHLHLDLAKKMNLPVSRIDQMINHLKDLKFINLDKVWDQNNQTWLENYSFLGLVEELADLWAIERVKEIEASKLNSGKHLEKVTPEANALQLVSLFEQEMGRPLTVLECEQIERWLISQYPEELIIEALRRGVSAGIRNFRYIDSILREWEKKGLKSLPEIEADDINFQARQEKRNKGQTVKKKGYDKYKNVYL